MKLSFDAQEELNINCRVGKKHLGLPRGLVRYRQCCTTVSDLVAALEVIIMVPRDRVWSQFVVVSTNGY